MPTVSPDYSFTRDGIPLSEWLLRLVSDKRSERMPAGEALRAMDLGLPSVHTNFADVDPTPDVERQRERFGAAVRSAVAAVDFPAADFIRRLVARFILAADDRMARMEQGRAWKSRCDAQFDRLTEAIRRRIAAARGDAVREAAEKRLQKALRASLRRDTRIDAETIARPEPTTDAPLMASEVFDALGMELLAAPEALHLLLDHPREAHRAYGALTRIGPPAVAFAPKLLQRIGAPMPEGCSFGNLQAALGSVGRGDAHVVRALLRWLDSPRAREAEDAALVLTHMGTDVAGQTEQLVHALLRRVNSQAHAGVFLLALASVGRHVPRARRRVLEEARARAPRMVESEPFPGFPHDETMYDRGTALEAMRYFIDYPEECVPLLMDALSTFVEYDPDECDDGDWGRVARILEAFGPTAAPAALPLAACLSARSHVDPRAVYRALRAIGPRAAPALHLLRQDLTRRQASDGAYQADLVSTLAAIEAAGGGRGERWHAPAGPLV